MATYKFRKSHNSRFSGSSEGHVTTEVIAMNFDFIGNDLIDELFSFSTNYDIVQVPSITYSMLKKLCEKYGLEEKQDSFLSLLCAIQELYIHMKNYSNRSNDKMIKEFEREYKSRLILIDIIENHLFPKDEVPKLHSISFKYDKGKSKVIKNTFTILDICKSICEGLEVNEVNFKGWKQKFIANTNRMNYEKAPEYLKTNVIQSLYKYLSNFEKSQNERKRFIGAFLSLAGIPINKSEDYEEFDRIEDIIANLDLKNLQHYITRPPKSLYH